MKKNKADSKSGVSVPANTPKPLIASQSGIVWQVGFLLLLVLILYRAFLFSDQMLFGSDTMASLDARTLYSEEMKKGVFPLWFPQRLSGMPTVDALFGDSFYPFKLLSLILPLHKAIGIQIVLHVMMAGLFFFFMAHKGFSLHKNISLLGAALYMLNTEFVSHTYPGHDGKMFVIALLPLAVWMLERLIAEATLWRACLLGLSIGLCLLTSHIQMTYFVLWGLFAYAVFRMVFIITQEKNKRKAFRFFGFFWVGVAVGLGLGMIQLLAPYMYVKEGLSVRGPEKGFEYAASWSLHPEEAASLIVPDFVNTLQYYWGQNPFKLNSEYAGLLANLLFVLALVFFWNRFQVFWLGVALFALLYALGAHTPVLKICYYLVPGVKSFRACSMMMFWFSFAVILGGTLGLGRLMAEHDSFSQNKKAKIWKNMLITAGVIGGLCLIFTIGKDAVMSIWQSMFYAKIPLEQARTMAANYPNFVKGVWIWGALTVGALLSISAYIIGNLKEKALWGILLGIGLIDLFRVNPQFIEITDPSPYQYADGAIRTVQRDPSPKRVFDLPGAYGNNYVGIFGLESVSGFHDNELRCYRNFRGENNANLVYKLAAGDIAGNPFLNLLNVKYLLYRAAKGQPVQVIPNPGSMERAFLADSYEVCAESLSAERLKMPDFSYRNTVLVEKDFPETPASDTLFIGSADYSRATPNRFTVQVRAARKSLLVVSEVFYPGWYATIDGRSAEIYRAYGALMAVAVPAGNHAVEFQMRSKYLNTGAWFTLGTLIFVAGIGLWQIRKRKLELRVKAIRQQYQTL